MLRSQNIIDSIRNAEIEENGMMEILPRNKRPGYSGYPSTAESHDNNRNATLGPSCPRMTTMARDIHLPQNETSDARRTKTDGTPRPLLRSNCHQNNPGDPDDGSLSDKTYLPSSTLYSNTESDVTDSESHEQSS